MRLGRLPEWVKLPCSAALPFGAFEAVLGYSPNSAVASAIQELAEKQTSSIQELTEVQSQIKLLQAPQDLQQQVKAAFQKSGTVVANMYVPGLPGIPGLYQCKKLSLSSVASLYVWRKYHICASCTSSKHRYCCKPFSLVWLTCLQDCITFVHHVHV